jgi:hypothetical protein
VCALHARTGQVRLIFGVSLSREDVGTVYHIYTNRTYLNTLILDQCTVHTYPISIIIK